MSTTWYAKLDSSFHANRKVRKAGRLGRELFVFLLCMNSNRGNDGWVPAADIELWYLADQLQMTEDEATRGIELAVTAGLITVSNDRVSITGWNKTWGRTSGAMTVNERQAKFRKSLGSNGDVTDHALLDRDEKSKSNDVTTGRKEGRKEGREREGKTRVLPHASAGASLSVGFAPSPEASKIALERDLDLTHELAQFEDWVATKAIATKNWDATFCKFLRGSRDIGRGSAPSPTAVVVATVATSPRLTRQRSAAYPGQFLEYLGDEFVRVVAKTAEGDWVEVPQKPRSPGSEPTSPVTPVTTVTGSNA